MTCQLCGKDKKLIKSHIIPKGFFKPMQLENKAALLYTNTENVHPKRSPIGFYDKNILCKECDAKLGVWDEYAQKLLLHSFNEDKAVYNGKDKVYYTIRDFDYKLLKLFFISMLWRASITSHKCFNRISTGPFEEKLKNFILSNSPGGEEEFPVTLAKFSNPDFKFVLDPHQDKFDHINYYRFYLTGFVAYIKVDKRNSVGLHKIFRIKKDEPILIILRDLHGSKDGDVMKEIASKNKQYINNT